MPVNNTNNKTPDEHINELCIKSNSSTSLCSVVAVPTSQDYYCQLYVVCERTLYVDVCFLIIYTYSNDKRHCVNHFQHKRYLKYLLQYVSLDH